MQYSSICIRKNDLISYRATQHFRVPAVPSLLVVMDTRKSLAVYIDVTGTHQSPASQPCAKVPPHKTRSGCPHPWETLQDNRWRQYCSTHSAESPWTYLSSRPEGNFFAISSEHNLNSRSETWQMSWIWSGNLASMLRARSSPPRPSHPTQQQSVSSSSTSGKCRTLTHSLAVVT